MPTFPTADKVNTSTVVPGFGEKDFRRHPKGIDDPATLINVVT